MRKLLRSLLIWLRLRKPEQDEKVLATVFGFGKTTEEVAAFIRENRLVVKKIRCKTHAEAPRLAEGYLTFYDLVCETKDNREHHVYVWQDTVEQSHAPILFRLDLKFAEPAYFGAIGLPGITILDPGETGMDEDEFIPPSYDEIRKADPDYYAGPTPVEIPETDEDKAILDEAKRVNMEMFRVTPKSQKLSLPTPSAPIEHRSLNFGE